MLGVLSTTVTRVTAGLDLVAIVKAIVACVWIQAEIQAMCVVGERGKQRATRVE